MTLRRIAAAATPALAVPAQADVPPEPAHATFALDAQGKIERITMRAVSPAADFSWDYQDLLFTPVKP